MLYFLILSSNPHHAHCRQTSGIDFTSGTLQSATVNSKPECGRGCTPSRKLVRNFYCTKATKSYVWQLQKPRGSVLVVWICQYVLRVILYRLTPSNHEYCCEHPKLTLIWTHAEANNTGWRRCGCDISYVLKKEKFIDDNPSDDDRSSHGRALEQFLFSLSPISPRFPPQIHAQ